jgi:formyltetrahydrofolate hydrolase
MTLTETIIGLVIGFISGYLISYFKEKGKNKALLSDIKRLTEEKERIISDFKLDIEKRKYQYESKKEQYFKYFNLIDEFGKSGNDAFYDNFFPIVERFNENYQSAKGNKEKVLAALNDFSASLNPMFSKSNENLVRLRAETKSIRLIASIKVRDFLGQLEELYDTSFEKSSLMLREMGNNMISDNQEIINEQNRELHVLGQKIETIHDELVEEIRKELNEI